MKAIQVEAPGVVRLIEAPRPVPGPDEALIEVAFVGVCHTDIEVMRGTHGAYASGRARYPIVPGHEWSGWVREVGADVRTVAPGDVVTGETGIGCLRCSLCISGVHNCCPRGTETGIINRDGAMREWHVQPAAFVHKLQSIPPDEGALVEPASVAVYACRRAGVVPGDRVAVCGGGSIGQLCVQAARAYGARYVMLTSRSAPKLRLAEELGADRAVNAAAEDLAAVARDVTAGEMFDVTIEAAGTAEALNDAVRIAGPRGRVAVLGYASSEPYGHSLGKLIGEEVSLIGVRGSPGVWPLTIDLIAQGRISVAPLMTRRLGLEQYEEAFGLVAAGAPDLLKVLLAP